MAVRTGFEPVISCVTGRRDKLTSLQSYMAPEHRVELRSAASEAAVLPLHHSGMFGEATWTRTRNAEATGLQPAAIPIPLIAPYGDPGGA